MADPNQFSDNFLSLLDNLKAKKPVSQSGDGEKETKNRKDSSVAKGNEEDKVGGGAKRKKGEEKRSNNDRKGKNDDWRFSQSNKDKVVVNSFKGNTNSANKDDRGKTFQNKRDQSKEGRNYKREKHDKPIPNSEASAEKLSEHFFSVLNNFDNSLTPNKTEGTKSKLRDKIDGERKRVTCLFDEGSNRNNTGGENNNKDGRRRNFGGYKKVYDKSAIGENSKNSDTHKDYKRNEYIQEGENSRRDSETTGKKGFRESKSTEKKVFKMMGYKFLESLLDKETSFVLTTLASARSGFQELVDSRPIRPDLLMLIVKVLDKINGSEAHQLKVQILSNTFKPEFIDEIKKFVSLICVEENRKRLEAMNTFFVNILNVLDTVANSLPSTMNEKFKSTLNAINLSMKALRDEHRITVRDQLFEQLNELTDQVNSYIENKNKIEAEHRHINKKDIPPPNSYRDIPLVPTKEDFMTDRGYLRQNIVKGSYSNVDHYLDVQFRLLREDFISPLREGIYEYIESLSTLQKKRRFTNVRIYHKVKFENPSTLRDVFGFFIQFDVEKKLPRNINWEYNKRFMTGSLLLFSDNDFQTFYLATVVTRQIESLQKGLLFVTFVPGTDVPDYLFDPGVFFVMAESEVYYEAYKHVLFALQQMNERNFPMKQYIVDVDTTCFPPAYLMDRSVYKISKFEVNLLDEYSWPTPEQLNLNPSQHQALKSALTNDFVVIQGPPGTGKTFLALKITEILLKNEVSLNTPIVVVCYTNHALDQFLEGILNYTKNLIRIGMQSQNEALQKYNLEEVRKQMKASRNHNLSCLYRDTMSEKFNIQEQLKIVKDKIEELSTPQGILDLNVLRPVIPPQQFNDLTINPDVFASWLFCYDDPESFMMESSLEEVVEMPSEISIPPDQNEVANNASGGLEEGLEEFDEEESARRLADLTEDDFFEEDFLPGRDYTRHLTYSLSFQQIESDIAYIEYEMKTTQHVNGESEYFFEVQSHQRIADLKWQHRFLQKQFSKVYDFKFNPERFHMFQNASSIWEIRTNDRWEYYAAWVHLYICQLKQIVQHLTKIYQDVLMKLHELRQMEDLRFVQTVSVVGLTTSGAAKRRVLLENLGTKIVIVEEAAEVLESHIVTSLAQSVQHVILIGDHKQLKPNPAVFKLAKKYNMDCSLFERMINNGLGCSVLKEQHRMRPEIASLITPTIYPHLANHPSTHDRPKIRGIDRFVFFLSHDRPEDQLPDSSSKQNTHEADLLMELCKYLLLNDYKPEEITILATYSGQVWYMRKKKREMGMKYPDIKAVRITPVDNFQGEENRIILLSLVRSNKENRIGFLSTENRVCVALSRAKEGLYIVGNMDNLTNSSSIWPRIKERLEHINAFGRKLTLRCERHPDQIIHVSEAKHFKPAPEGGCSQNCETELNCGHTCRRICHIIDQDHRLYRCKEKCERPPCLVEGHKCPLLCWRVCEPCVIRVEKKLPCGHTAKLKCHEEPAAHKCQESVPAVHPACNHEILKPCYLNVNDCFCTNDCSFRLPCGHACVRRCHVNDDPDHLKYKCFKDCAKEYKGCPRKQHPCLSRCYEECGPCTVPMSTILPCGHHFEIPCSDDPNTFKCTRNCERIMDCKHKCKLPCWVTCDPALCTARVDKEAPCGHIMIKMKCNESTDKRVCKENCSRTLPCGHKCPDKCRNDCAKVLCQTLVASPVAPSCGHPAIEIPCHLNKSGLNGGSDELVQLCKQPCGQRQSCGHECQGTCGKCLQGRLHVPCVEKCNKTLICGHECTNRCSTLCPPCTKKRCLTKCSHRSCYVPNTKNHNCFKPCDPCDNRCLWSCEHLQCNKRCGDKCDRPPCYEPCPLQLKCGHNCMGYCGERCPPFCPTCAADEDTHPGDRYVVLEDCNHVVSSQLMDDLVANATRNNTFRLIECPQPDCAKPVANTPRYRHVYFGFRSQIVKIENLLKMDETCRLLKIHGRHATLLQSDPTVSKTMNLLMRMCSMPFKGTILDQKEMGRLIVGCLLQPLAIKCADIKSKKDIIRPIRAKPEESDLRMRFRLEYLANALISRLDQISYDAILQVELMIVNFLRLASSLEYMRAVHLSWFDVTPYTWERDLEYKLVEPLAKLSATLKTRDSRKQWFLCVNQHLFVSENGEDCITCSDEIEEIQRRLIEEEAQQKGNKTQRGERNTNRGKLGGPTDYRKKVFPSKGSGWRRKW